MTAANITVQRVAQGESFFQLAFGSLNNKHNDNGCDQAANHWIAYHAWYTFMNGKSHNFVPRLA